MRKNLHSHFDKDVAIIRANTKAKTTLIFKSPPNNHLEVQLTSVEFSFQRTSFDALH